MKRLQQEFLAVHGEFGEGRAKAAVGHFGNRFQAQMICIAVRWHVFVAEAAQRVLPEAFVDRRQDRDGLLGRAIILRQERAQSLRRGSLLHRRQKTNRRR